MKFLLASALLATAMPLFAQEPAADATTEALFYKAYYLEKGQREFAKAMVLYEQFLEKAPKHELAQEAARLQFRLLDRTGKAKERDAFKEKYKDLLGNMAEAQERPERGEGRGVGEGERPERGNRRAGGMGAMGLLRGDTKIADMDEEQMKQLKEGIEGSTRMIERFRERMPEMAEKLEKSTAALKAALDAGKTEEAQKALDALRESFQGMRRGGGRGEGDQGNGEGRRRRREGGAEGGGGAPRAGGGGGDR